MEQGVKRSTAPRASADMQNKGEMCKTCKIAKHVKLAQSCESLHVQVGKIWPQMKMIEVKSKTRFLVSTLNRSFINCALFNTDICPQPKNQYFVS